MNTLNYDFIARAERLISFNLATKDFETLDYKSEIQHLIQKHYFPNFDLGDTLKHLDKEKVNDSIACLKSHDIDKFKSLLNYALRGVGPAEVLFYFLIDTAKLGGGGSSGADIIIIDGTEYEIKGIRAGQDGLAYEFKLGGTVPISDIQQSLIRLAKELKLNCFRDNELNGGHINAMIALAPSTYNDIEKQFKTIAYDHYFSKHNIIFVNTKGGLKTIGRIESIKQVTQDEIFIERVSNGTIKPKVIL